MPSSVQPFYTEFNITMQGQVLDVCKHQSNVDQQQEVLHG